MELGQKLKAARLEAGLSQRQLCGDTITRNMLSQIENGSAKPSYATLQALCARLGKPVSFFWEDAPSQNSALLRKALSAPAEQALAYLKSYLSPDPLLDPWYYQVTARCFMDLAEQAIEENRAVYALELLLQAEDAFKKAGAWAEPFCRRLTLLRFAAGTPAQDLILPDNTDEQLLRAHSALSAGDAAKCLACLDAADRQTERGQLLRGDVYQKTGQYEKAIACFAPLEESEPAAVYPRLEQCYKELGDFKKAYEYACKQR